MFWNFPRLLAIICLICAIPARAERVDVAVASNFAAPMRDIVTHFNAVSGHDVRMSFGSSGRFFAQISNGAPFDLFFSADAGKPLELIELGLAEAGSNFTYAVGRLVLWSAQDDLVSGPETLETAAYRKLALANPAVAPYGQAAVDFLERSGQLEASRSRWVQGENIAQVYQFIFSGNAELGLVAYSQVIDRERGGVLQGSGWLVPEDLHSPIRQDAVVLQHGRDSEAARQLVDYMHSVEAGAIITSYGYEISSP